MRVLEWIIQRCLGEAGAVETPVGAVPADGAINTTHLDIDPATLKALSAIDRQGWQQELDQIEDYLRSYGERVPDALLEELERVKSAL